MDLAIATDFMGGTGDPERALRLIAEAGFTHLHWCHQWCTDFIYGQAELDHISSMLGKYGLSLLDIHGSAGVEKCWFSPVEYQRRAGVELVLNRLEMFERLNGEGSLMMHIPHTTPFLLDSDRLNAEVKTSALERSLDELMPSLERHGWRIALENMWCDDWKILEKILSSYSSEHIGVCYDSGHANSADFPQMDFLDAHRDRLIALHLHDNDGKRDLHQIPCTNTVDWKRLSRIIGTSSYKGPISFELSMVNTPFWDAARREHGLPQTDCDAKRFLAAAYVNCRKFAETVR